MNTDLFDYVPEIADGIIRWLDREEHPAVEFISANDKERIWQQGIPEKIYEEMEASVWINGAYEAGMWAWLLFSCAFDDVVAHYGEI